LFNLLPQGSPLQSLSQITKNNNNNFKNKKNKKTYIYKFRNLPFAPTEVGVPVLGVPAAAVGLCSPAVGFGGSGQQVNRK
jgi:hypothetical protein